MLVIGRSYYEEMLTGDETMTGEDVRTKLMGTKLTGATESSV